MKHCGHWFYLRRKLEGPPACVLHHAKPLNCTWPRFCGISRIQSRPWAWQDQRAKPERPHHATFPLRPPPRQDTHHDTAGRLPGIDPARQPGPRQRQAIGIQHPRQRQKERRDQNHLPAQQLRRNHCRARPPHVPRMQRHAQRGCLPGVYAEIATAHPCIAAIRPKGHGAAQPRPLAWLACKQRHHSARPSPAASRACDRRIRASPPLS